MQVTVFAPHPDDEIIGCGGSVVNWLRSGAEVSFVYLCNGDAGSQAMSRAELGAVRKAEATAGAAHLGVTDLVFLDQTDGCLAETRTLLTTLIDLIREKRPDVAYLPHATDGHPDHIVTHQLVTKAAGIAAGPWWPESTGAPWAIDLQLAYEVWTPIQRPTHLEDTTDALDLQLEALSHHGSQLDTMPYDAFIRGLGSYRGATLGAGRSAEAFEVLRLGTLPGRTPVS
ncbi:PIG-L deacetylase family protein [Amycolatopsis jejuensis]|uniref:PIG-L deacetylase family protein n=1 Tax=Amycolatopsis jejuensis TaxID=330084 RepID=UPI0005250B9C|nr:PIG-L family deacetylase [Amycolatopsis jejuensis]